MSAPGGMGRESRKSYARLSDMISEERQKQLYVYDKISKKKSFALANSLGTCLRGSRSVYDTSNTYSMTNCMFLSCHVRVSK